MTWLLLAAWIGTWGASPQPPFPGAIRTFDNQTIRLIVHTSAGGSKARVRISNLYGDRPLVIGAAHIARRATAADVDPATDRALTFRGNPAVTVAPGAMVVSDAVAFELPALSDVAISLFLPQNTEAKTSHALAKQTNYSSTPGNFVAQAKFPVASTFRIWPFVTGVDVERPQGETIVAFGSSLTDGDGTSADTNHRYPDILAQRLQAAGETRFGVLNEGIIGNRLLRDSPEKMKDLFGAALGQAGMQRFDRDVLSQPGVKYVIVALGVNDILMPGQMSPSTEVVTAQDLIDAYRQLIKLSHHKGIRVIGSTIPGFENSLFKDPPMQFYTPEKEAVRQKVNDWILHSGEFDGLIDFDAVVRDPDDPKRIRPDYDSGDHLHPNDAGAIAEGEAIGLSLFR
jgi:lysophospholipase L1-like esterase